MQTIITETLDFGIPGEFASTNPRYVEMPYFVNTAVAMGTVVAVKDNTVAPVGTANFTAKKGITVSTHQKVNRGSAGNALAPTLTLAVGDEVAIVTMGDVYVEEKILATISTAISGKDTKAEAEAAAKAALDAALKAAMPKRGASVYYQNSDGRIQNSSTSATALGTVRDAADRFCGAATYTFTAEQDASTQKWGVPTSGTSAIQGIVIALGL